MPRAAVALASPTTPAAGARSNEDQNRRTFRPRRVHALLIGIGIVAIWLVFVFAKALGDVDRATARRVALAAEAATLQARLDADRRELELVQTDGFQRLQARAYGMGYAGEIVFSLPLGAPSPAPITPLGGQQPAAPVSVTSATPLDAWLKILFGS